MTAPANEGQDGSSNADSGPPDSGGAFSSGDYGGYASAAAAGYQGSNPANYGGYSGIGGNPSEGASVGSNAYGSYGSGNYGYGGSGYNSYSPSGTYANAAASGYQGSNPANYGGYSGMGGNPSEGASVGTGSYGAYGGGSAANDIANSGGGEFGRALANFFGGGGRAEAGSAPSSSGPSSSGGSVGQSRAAEASGGSSNPGGSNRSSFGGSLFGGPVGAGLSAASPAMADAASASPTVSNLSGAFAALAQQAMNTFRGAMNMFTPGATQSAAQAATPGLFSTPDSLGIQSATASYPAGSVSPTIGAGLMPVSGAMGLEEQPDGAFSRTDEDSNFAPQEDRVLPPDMMGPGSFTTPAGVMSGMDFQDQGNIRIPDQFTTDPMDPFSSNSIPGVGVTIQPWNAPNLDQPLTSASVSPTIDPSTGLPAVQEAGLMSGPGIQRWIAPAFEKIADYLSGAQQEAALNKALIAKPANDVVQGIGSVANPINFGSPVGLSPEIEGVPPDAPANWNVAPTAPWNSAPSWTPSMKDYNMWSEQGIGALTPFNNAGETVPESTVARLRAEGLIASPSGYAPRIGAADQVADRYRSIDGSPVTATTQDVSPSAELSSLANWGNSEAPVSTVSSEQPLGIGQVYGVGAPQMPAPSDSSGDITSSSDALPQDYVTTVPDLSGAFLGPSNFDAASAVSNMTAPVQEAAYSFAPPVGDWAAGVQSILNYQPFANILGNVLPNFATVADVPENTPLTPQTPGYFQTLQSASDFGGLETANPLTKNADWQSLLEAHAQPNVDVEHLQPAYGMALANRLNEAVNAGLARPGETLFTSGYRAPIEAPIPGVDPNNYRAYDDQVAAIQSVRTRLGLPVPTRDQIIANPNAYGVKGLAANVFSSNHREGLAIDANLGSSALQNFMKSGVEPGTGESIGGIPGKDVGHLQAPGEPASATAGQFTTQDAADNEVGLNIGPIAPMGVYGPGANAASYPKVRDTTAMEQAADQTAQWGPNVVAQAPSPTQTPGLTTSTDARNKVMYSPTVSPTSVPGPSWPSQVAQGPAPGGVGLPTSTTSDTNRPLTFSQLHQIYGDPQRNMPWDQGPEGIGSGLLAQAPSDLLGSGYVAPGQYAYGTPEEAAQRAAVSAELSGVAGGPPVGAYPDRTASVYGDLNAQSAYNPIDVAQHILPTSDEPFDTGNVPGPGRPPPALQTTDSGGSWHTLANGSRVFGTDAEAAKMAQDMGTSVAPTVTSAAPPFGNPQQWAMAAPPTNLSWGDIGSRILNDPEATIGTQVANTGYRPSDFYAPAIGPVDAPSQGTPAELAAAAFPDRLVNYQPAFAQAPDDFRAPGPPSQLATADNGPTMISTPMEQVMHNIALQQLAQGLLGSQPSDNFQGTTFPDSQVAYTPTQFSQTPIGDYRPPPGSPVPQVASNVPIGGPGAPADTPSGVGISGLMQSINSGLQALTNAGKKMDAAGQTGGLNGLAELNTAWNTVGEISAPLTRQVNALMNDPNVSSETSAAMQSTQAMLSKLRDKMTEQITAFNKLDTFNPFADKTKASEATSFESAMRKEGDQLKSGLSKLASLANDAQQQAVAGPAFASSAPAGPAVASSDLGDMASTPRAQDDYAPSTLGPMASYPAAQDNYAPPGAPAYVTATPGTSTWAPAIGPAVAAGAGLQNLFKSWFGSPTPAQAPHYQTLPPGSPLDVPNANEVPPQVAQNPEPDAVPPGSPVAQTPPDGTLTQPTPAPAPTTATPATPATPSAPPSSTNQAAPTANPGTQTVSSSTGGADTGGAFTVADNGLGHGGGGANDVLPTSSSSTGGAFTSTADAASSLGDNILSNLPSGTSVQGALDVAATKIKDPYLLAIAQQQILQRYQNQNQGYTGHLYG